MKYYIISGEASGDLHGANLLKEIRKQDPNAQFRAWGGDLLEAEGAEIIKHYRDLAFMGFIEVVMNLRTILKNISFCKEDILQWQPDVLILIDYPGFNLRIAEFAHEKGIKVAYYISPQIWAWKQNRVHKIKKVVDSMLVILPFEKDFYSKFDMEVEFVGHPLLDELAAKPADPEWRVKHGLGDQQVIALLPGSRKQEISTVLPLMLEAVKPFTNHTLVIAAAPGQSLDFYKEMIGGRPEIKILKGETYNLLRNAHAALVTSGTATLETALIGVPEVVCYKGNAISVQIARHLIKVKFISLVNLIMDREIVKELIQQDLSVENLQSELNKILKGAGRTKMLEEYRLLQEKLSGVGASAKAAKAIQRLLDKK
jgi:lipid-A-disaccharide synthase